MYKRVKKSLLIIWCVMSVLALYTVCCMREFRNDLAVIQDDVHQLRRLTQDLEADIVRLSTENEDLRAKIEELQTPIVEVAEIETIEPEFVLSEDEIYLLALVTVAEAEGEPEEGKRLVIDTVLNRMESDYSYWPDTVTEVIYQPAQFSSMWGSRVDRCHVTDDVIALVREELISRTNKDVVYFRTNHYSKYGTPMFQVGNHYFSGM